jgi:hypothetical protein
MTVNIAGRKTVLKVVLADVGKDRLGGDDVDRVRRPVDPPRMRLQVLGHGECPEQGLFPNVPRTTLSEVINQCQRGDELPVLGNVPLESGGQLMAA